jgi:hypothetical protein
MHPMPRSTSGSLWSFTVEIRLSQNYVSRLSITFRHTVPDKHAMVARVGDDQQMIIQVDATRRTDLRRRRIGKRKRERTM